MLELSRKVRGSATSHECHSSLFLVEYNLKVNI